MPAFSRTLLVEIQLGGVWTDVTQYVLQTDPVSITRGTADESSKVGPSQCELSFNDGPTGGNGRFTPDNPLGPYYGQLRQYTPLRVSIDGSRRFTGEVAELKPRWDESHRHRVVSCTAAGILRRLEKTTAPVPPPFITYMNSLTLARMGFWPLDEGPDAESHGVPSTPTVLPVTFERETGTTPPTGTVAWGEATDQPSLLRAPEITNSGRLVAYFPSGFGTSWSIWWGQRTSVDAGGRVIINTSSTTFTPAVTWWTDGTIQLAVTLAGPGDTSIGIHTPAAPGYDDVWHLFGVSFTQSGGNVVCTLYKDGVEVVSGSIAATLAGPTRARFLAGAGNEPNAVSTILALNEIPNIAIRQGFSEAFFGWVGETVGNRISALCTEHGITFTGIGDLFKNEQLGPQRVEPLIDLLHTYQATDQGVLFEPLTGGLGYRGREDIYNQAVSATADYSNEQVAAPFLPITDDQRVTNKVTVRREGGTEATYERTTGSLSTASPPSGVGVVSSSLTVDLSRDERLKYAAQHLVGRGTVEGPRWPAVTVNYAAPAVDGTLETALFGTIEGERINITGLDAALVYDDARLIVAGYTETLEDQYRHSVTFNCVPAEPFDVWQLESGDYGRIHTEGLTVTTSVSSTASTMSVTVAAGHALATTAAGDMPVRIRVAGITLTVTAISGASSPQTFTISSPSATKTLPAGSPVELADRHGLAW